MRDNSRFRLFNGKGTDLSKTMQDMQARGLHIPFARFFLPECQPKRLLVREQGKRERVLSAGTHEASKCWSTLHMGPDYSNPARVVLCHQALETLASTEGECLLLADAENAKMET